MKLIRSGAAPAIQVSGNLQRFDLEGCNTRLFAALKGCTVDSHGHERSEEVYLLSGRLRVGEHVMAPGDLLRTDAGEFHDAEALEDCRFLVMNTLDPA